MFGIRWREFVALLGGAAALRLQVALAASLLMCPAMARDDGRFSHLPTDVRDWFRSQKSPVSGEHCCDEADGTYVEEDIRDGNYWVRWSTVGKWQRVPNEVIIHAPNRVGLPVVWWHYDHLGVRIRCFVPAKPEDGPLIVPGTRHNPDMRIPAYRALHRADAAWA